VAEYRPLYRDPTSGQVQELQNGNTIYGATGINLLQVTVDFGSDTGAITRRHDATASVSATWVTTSSIIVCSPAGVSTTQHGIDDGLFEGLVAQAESLVSGTGFTLHVYSPLGSWGQYTFNCIGY